MTTAFEQKLPSPADAEFEQAVRDSFARQGLMATLGAWLVEVAAGRVVIELPYSDRISQQPGEFHGAAVTAIAEVSARCAALSLLRRETRISTVSSAIDFPRPARGLLLRAEGRVLCSEPSRTTNTRSEVFVLGGKQEGLCAAAQTTFAECAVT